MHGLAKVGQHLFRAAPAGFLLIGIAGFAADQFLVFVGHGSAANPFASLMNMDMIEFGHSSLFLVRRLMTCAGSPALDTMLFPAILRRYT